jgi:hypothetical protein
MEANHLKTGVELTPKDIYIKYTSDNEQCST